MKTAIKHFKLICAHKKEVFKTCWKAGIPFRGLKHDLSKFSPTEFLESVRYYSGSRSPIDSCKDDKGYSMAWFHHRGRNRHHWEYWVDNFEKGITPILMPFDDCLEMLCDFIGAGKAYNKENFSWKGELDWWITKRKIVIMHPVVWHFIDYMMQELCANNNDSTLTYEQCYLLYKEIKDDYEAGTLPEMYNSKTRLIDFEGQYERRVL